MASSSMLAFLEISLSIQKKCTIAIDLCKKARAKAHGHPNKWQPLPSYQEGLDNAVHARSSRPVLEARAGTQGLPSVVADLRYGVLISAPHAQ